jgi:hypothetical protein
MGFLNCFYPNSSKRKNPQMNHSLRSYCTFAGRAALVAAMFMFTLSCFAESLQTTNTILNISPSGTLVAGETFTASATVTPVSGNGIVSGSVIFQITTPDGNEFITAGVNLVNGVARYTGVLPGGVNDYEQGAGVLNVGAIYEGSTEYYCGQIVFQNANVASSGYALSALPVTLNNGDDSLIMENLGITTYYVGTSYPLVALSATGLPNGVSFHWSNNPTYTDAGSNLQLVAYEDGVTPGSYNLPITGTSGTAGSPDYFTASTNLLLTVLPSGTATIAINADGPPEGIFTAENDCVGGGSSTSKNVVNLSSMASGAAPAALFQNQRAGNFTCTIPGLQAGSNHTVALFFDEFYFSAPFKRMFNVSINGTPVLTNFDMYATAGKNNAFAEAFPATANSAGQIIVSFASGQVDQPSLAGIEVW